MAKQKKIFVSDAEIESYFKKEKITSCILPEYKLQRLETTTTLKKGIHLKN